MDPHSPWQILVDSRVQDLGISTRALAKALDEEKKGISNTTIWAWTRNPEGCPPRSAYSEKINFLLAQALQLKPEVLAQAYEDSRRHFFIKESEVSQRGPLRILRRIFTESKQKNWTTVELIQIIDDMEGL